MGEHPQMKIAEVTRLIDEAEALVKAERPRAALERANEALRASEGLPDAWRAAVFHARGRAHDLLGDLEAAQADLAVACDLDPASPQRWMFMGQLGVSQEQWSTARELFATAIQVADAVEERSVIPPAHWELAGIARILGDVDGARRELAASIKIAEELGDVQAAAYAELDLAQLSAEQGDVDSARQLYARVRAVADLLPERDRRVSAEPQNPVSPDADGIGAKRLPPPTDREPVLRVVMAPQLGEHAEVELWPYGGANPLRCVVPFRFTVHPRTHKRLRWYLEEYAARPLDPAPAMAAHVEKDLEDLGEALFRAVLGGPESAEIATRLPEVVGRLRVEIVADAPAADVLAWELLRDPANHTNFALTGRSITRTTSRAPGMATAIRDDGPLRILIAIARPEGRLDVGFRSVAGPLLRELTTSGALVEVDVLRPPTFGRLQEVLRESDPYDLLHFDGHGVVDVDSGRSALVFESGDGAGIPVSGEALGEALREGGVPLLVMNACRSAAGFHEQVYGSVAREALERGLAAVVAMRFNVYVPTAALFIGGLYRYRALGENRALEDGVTEARRLLTERTDRGGLPVVRDWCVPALYQAQPVRLASPAAATTRAAPEVGLRPPPRHGFVGRDEVFVELEAALVASSHVVLRAFAGAGKTATASEFARWYVRTGGCGVAGPHVSLADAPSADELRERCGPIEERPLLVWDDVRELTDDHVRLLNEIATRGGRVVVLRDRRPDLSALPVVSMPNLPREEAYALALAVADDAGTTLTPEAAVAVADGLWGHALAIELAVGEIARRGGATMEGDVEPLLAELVFPRNGDPALWARPLGEGLDVDGNSRDETLVAQFRGYVSVPGLGSLRDGNDFDAAERALEALAARGLLTPVGPGIYAIHLGLPVALAAAGRYEPPGRAFAHAMAETASAWGALAETQGMPSPWPAEAANIVAARRLASREGWWPLVVRLLEGVSALGEHGGMTQLQRTEILDASADFVDPNTGQPLPGMEEHRDVFLGHLAWVAEVEGDYARAVRLRTTDVNQRRAAARGALAVPSDRRTDAEHTRVRRLAVGLTNLGPTQTKLGDPATLDT